MTSKKLTITFPLYGQHDMVRRAFTALTRQTFQDFKVVCFDDKSPEGFEELIKEFSDRLDITLIYNETNLGAMLNIWQSIQHATETPYLLSHHADDFLKADYLEKAISILENQNDVSFVVTGPQWVDANIPYHYATLGDTKIDTFDAADFAHNVLNFAPYIFGSVVYRVKDLINDWKFEEMDTYCDRYFLGEILRTRKTKGAYVNGNGIYERDHSKDEVDDRSPRLNEDHAIALLSFYKELLREKYPTKETDKIITNALLYYYGNFTERSGLVLFYKKQHRHRLLQLHRIRLLGLYALISLPFPPMRKRSIIKTVKKLIRK